jgi:ribonucleoside-diphosphate reductase alpha chain
VTHKFSIAGHDGYLTVGQYEDGEPGEMFLKMAKEGSTISGLMDSVAVVTSMALQHGVPLKTLVDSMALQHGVPLKTLVDKLSHKRFEPSGFTQNSEIPFAKSVMDYVFRWMGFQYLKEEAPVGDAQEEDAADVGLEPERGSSERVVPIRGGSHDERAFVGQEDAPPCMSCGTIMTRAGACYLCPTCGESGGCG